MKNLFLILTIVIALLLTACGTQSDDNNVDIVTTNLDVETQVTEQNRANTPDTLPDDLNFNGETINIYYFGMDESHYYDAVGEMSGDIVYDAVYNRNLSVEERLNVKFNWIRGSDDWNTHPTNVSKAILADVQDYDIILEESSRAFQHSLQGFFIDLIDAPYIDYNQPWWYVDFMNEGSIDTAKRYFITGDFNVTALFGASAIYFNKSLYTNYFGDVNTIYQTVLDGKWTHEELMKYSREIYTDANGNGEVDENDIFGFRFVQWGLPNYLSMSTGLTFSSRDADGLPIMDLNNENAVKWSETLYKLLYTDNMSIESTTNDTIEDEFIQEKSLFLMGMFSTANKLRDCPFDYGIIPYPKLYETLDYMSAAGTVNGNSVTIPISAPEGKYDVSCAVIEALCAEAYRTVIPSWYDTALKVKYADAEIDAEMVDLIYNTIASSFIMMADKTMGIGSIFTKAVVGSDSESAYVSYLAANEKSFQTQWDNMIDKYLELSDGN